MGDSRRRDRSHQSAKPRPDFPLTAHVTGRWCKKIRGRLVFFGKIVPDDGGASAQAALDKWLREKDDLLAGRVPREREPEGITLRDVAIAFLRHKNSLLKSGELSPRTFQDAHRTCGELIGHFGKHRRIDDFRQEDFAAYRIALAERFSPVTLGNAIQKTRSVFKYAFESGMLKTLPVFGPGFKRPSKKTLRLDRAKKGPKLFERDELLKLLEVAGPSMKAMILLACNAGLGNSDLANMPLSSLNLETGWVNYPRPKTGIQRRFPLWPETIKALKVVLAKRPKPKSSADAGLLFVTKYGGRWCKAIFERRAEEAILEQPAGEQAESEYRINNDNAITKEFCKLFAEAKVERKKGLGFYAMRHVFETIAGESRDQIAVDHIMGHARDDMASVYRERISDERLAAVVEHVRTWLFSPPASDKAAPQTKSASDKISKRSKSKA
jgi:integrase